MKRHLARVYGRLISYIVGGEPAIAEPIYSSSKPTAVEAPIFSRAGNNAVLNTYCWNETGVFTLSPVVGKLFYSGIQNPL